MASNNRKGNSFIRTQASILICLSFSLLGENCVLTSFSGKIFFKAVTKFSTISFSLDERITEINSKTHLSIRSESKDPPLSESSLKKFSTSFVISKSLEFQFCIIVKKSSNTGWHRVTGKCVIILKGNR